MPFVKKRSEKKRSEVVLRTLTGPDSQGHGLEVAIINKDVDQALIRLDSGVRGLRSRMMATVVGLACDQTGLTTEELTEGLSQSDNQLLLAAAVADAAMRTTMQAKIVAFARILAEAAKDGSAVDVDRILVATLARLEGPHLRLLALLATEPPSTQIQGHAVTPRGWRPEQISKASANLAIAMEMLLPVLRSEGLIDDVGTEVSWTGAIIHDYQWVATSHGRYVLVRLQELSRTPED